MSPNISSSGIHFWYTMTTYLTTNTGKCLQISPVQVFISDTQWQLISPLIQENVSKYLQSGIHFWYTMTIDLTINTGKCLQISPVQVFISDTQWQLILSPIQGNVSKYLQFRYSFMIHNDNWSHHQYRQMSPNISTSGIHFCYTMTGDHITNTGKYKEWKNRCQKTWWDTCWWTDDDWLCGSAETKQVRKTGNIMWIMQTKLLLSVSLSL